MSKAVTSKHAEWVQLVHEAGPFLTLPVLRRAFPSGLDRTLPDLRAMLRDWPADEVRSRTFVEWVLTDLLEYGGKVLSGQSIPDTLVATVPPGVVLRPDFAIGDRVLVHLHEDLTNPAPDPRWSASPVDRMAVHLRSVQGPELGLVTDGERFTLVWAPRTGAVGRATWHTSVMAEPAERTLLDAFTSVLGAKRLIGVADENTLEALLRESQDAQTEVTKQLGIQVRQAVELLVASIGDRGGKLVRAIEPSVVYEAACTVLMRLVILLYAEERHLLPLGDELYDRSYAVSTLRGLLRDDADREGNVQLLEHRVTAWPRLLALFRAVHGGLTHDELRLPAYGGRLFDPDRFPFLEGRTSGSTWRDEDADPLPVDDHSMLEILNALQVLELRQGSVTEARRLSFRTLDVEQIGHVYEGLLDHGAKRVDEVVCGLTGKSGQEPEVSLSALESAADVSGFLVKRTALSKSRVSKLLSKPLDEDRARMLLAACEGDQSLFGRLSPFAWLLRDDLRGVPMVVHPESLYVTDTSSRRDTGTQYTTKELADEIAHYTLEPLVYSPGRAEGASPSDWKLKSADEILALRVCDPAVGSGAILVAACRYLAEKLRSAWALADDPRAEDEDAEILSMRAVAERCLYGVDRNPMAVEMAKLSLWLVTMARERPFTFLDHALQPGDSLLGITDLRQVERFHIDPDRAGTLHSSMIDYVGSLAPAVRRAVELRRQIESTPVVTVADAEEKSRLLRSAEVALEAVHVVADLVVGAALSLASRPSGELDACLASITPRLATALNCVDPDDRRTQLRDVQAKADGWLNEGRPPSAPVRRPLHWPLSFPEMFLDRAAPGFDAMVGNPPFLGGQRITGAMGTDFRQYLVSHIADGARGSADLVTYFFLRASQVSEGFGFLATNTISQGDTREVGLDQLLERKWTIRRAVKSTPWPGAATLEVAKVWCHRAVQGDAVLDGTSVVAITSSLDPVGRVTGKPYRLAENAGRSFQGSNILGLGFTMSPAQAQALMEQDQRNKDVLFPYLNGEDLNTSPTHQASRWVINFRDWPLEKASEYPSCLSIVEAKVKPERDKVNRKARRERWWQFAERAPRLYAAIEGRARTLCRALTSKHHAFAFVALPLVIDQTAPVIVSDGDFDFGVLQSDIHALWARRWGATLETRLRYTPSDCFETFPQPDYYPPVAAAGAALDENRRQLMVANNQGLTKTYNRVHNPDDPDPGVHFLRELHVALDEAVARAYSWDDLIFDHGFHPTSQGIRYTVGPKAQDEILSRLLELNHARAARATAVGLPTS